MITWRDVLVEEERRKDLMRTARMFRVAQLAAGRRGGSDSLPRGALARLGRALVRLGTYLQKSQGETPMIYPQPAGACHR